MDGMRCQEDNPSKECKRRRELLAIRGIVGFHWKCPLLQPILLLFITGCPQHTCSPRNRKPRGLERNLVSSLVNCNCKSTCSQNDGKFRLLDAQEVVPGYQPKRKRHGYEPMISLPSLGCSLPEAQWPPTPISHDFCLSQTLRLIGVPLPLAPTPLQAELALISAKVLAHLLQFLIHAK